MKCRKHQLEMEWRHRRLMCPEPGCNRGITMDLLFAVPNAADRLDNGEDWWELPLSRAGARLIETGYVKMPGPPKPSDKPLIVENGE